MPQYKALILLIDPDAGMLQARRDEFRNAGYDVLTAGTGKEGLALFVADPVDVAVIAYRMPDMMGEFVAAWIKTISPRVPIVMFSPGRPPSRRQRRYVDVFLSAKATGLNILDSVDQLLQRTTKTFWDRWWREWKVRARLGPQKPRPLKYRLPESWKSG
jgi:CheY-like chemotaxis protein